MPFNERPEPTVTVVSAADSSRSGDWGDSINVPRARDRFNEIFERNQGPQQVEQTLAAALNGDLRYQNSLFVAMLDSWPKLQKNINEQARKVVTAPWKVHPFYEPGEKPKPKDEKFAKEVESMIWGMRPNVPRLEVGFEGLVRTLAIGYYFGHDVEEIRWMKSKNGMWKPRATKTVPSEFYGYPYDTDEKDPEDRLMFNPNGTEGAQQFEDFPEHRFLIGINSGHPGHPSQAAPLRALAFYWLASVRGLKWMMQFTQRFGIPFIHAKSDDKSTQGRLAQMMQQIGTEGWAVTENGATLEVTASNSSGQSLPQRELMKIADDAADIFILGQTLTSGTDNSGSRALGEVHAHTQNEMVDAVSDYVGSILTYQFIPSIIALNWGDVENLPQLWAKREEVKDEKALAERDEKLGITTGKTPVAKVWFYERHGIPMPAEGDELLIEEVEEDPEPDPTPEDTDDPDDDPEKPKQRVKAAEGKPLTVDVLADNVLEGLTGVAREWLGPVRPFFTRLAALAMSNQVSDEDFVAILEKAQRELPEIFDLMDTQALQEAFENAIGSAALAGSVSRYE